MLRTGANIDVKELEEKIRKEIDEKRKRLFTDDELLELQNLELNIIPNPDRVRTFFHKELELDFTQPDMKFYEEGNYNIDLNTFLHSANSPFLMKLRNWFKPFFRLYGNIDALIHKQSVYNREQAQFNTGILGSVEKTLGKMFHYIRTLHTLINYLVSELTKLNLQHQMLKSQVDALAYDIEQLKKRERLFEKMAVLKET